MDFVCPSLFTQTSLVGLVSNSSYQHLSIELTIIDVLMMLERFIEWVNTHEGVEWVPMQEIARDFRERNEPPKGARMPAGL